MVLESINSICLCDNVKEQEILVFPNLNGVQIVFDQEYTVNLYLDVKKLHSDNQWRAIL